MSRAIARLAAGVALALGTARVAEGQTHLVIVSGLGGEKKYSTAFNDIASHLADAAATRWGILDADDIWLGEDSVAVNRPHYRGQATKANVEQTLTKLAARAGPGDQVVLVLIGHGSGEGEETKISIPGPDLSARDFAQLLARFPTQKVAFINLTSASGDMLPFVSALGGSVDINKSKNWAIRLSPDLMLEHFGTETRTFFAISGGVVYRIGKR